MPKQTYKCDHCSHTSINLKNILEHEKECYLNPDVKPCITCGFKIWGEYVMALEIVGCKKNIPNLDEMGDIKHCKSWETDNI